MDSLLSIYVASHAFDECFKLILLVLFLAFSWLALLHKQRLLYIMSASGGSLLLFKTVTLSRTNCEVWRVVVNQAFMP